MSKAEKSILQSHQIIAEYTSDAAIEINADGKILFINPSTVRTFGYSADYILNRDVKELIHRSSEEQFMHSLQSALAGNGHKKISLTGLDREGQPLSLELFFIPHRVNNEIRAVAMIRNFTRRERFLDEFKASKESYEALTETTTDAILQINEELKIQFANTAIQKVFGFNNKELINQDFSLLFPHSIYNRNIETFKRYFIIDDAHRQDTKLTTKVEILGKNKENEIVPLEISFGNSKSVGQKRILTCIVRDISERKKTERKLRYLAYHDKLTDLGNRDLFTIALNDFLSQTKRYDDSIGALLFMDLDGFKKVNDTLGHNVGDKILRECGKRLGKCLRQSDHLFRFGGDEFVILLTRLKKSIDAAIVAQKIINIVRQPYLVKEFQSISKINLGVSIGIALIPENGNDPTILISSADIAMYKAKEQGNNYVFFTKDMNKKATERLLLEHGLRNSLETQGFELHYQPLVSSEGSIKGVEALCRWPNPMGGFISPGKFIPVAEETGLIIPLGDWIFETACRQLNEWNKKCDLYMSINLSPKQLNQDMIVEKVSAVIRRIQVNPKNLRLEITEGCIMSDPDKARIKLERIKQNNPGLLIAIDDFGIGYSSLSYLSEFPVDVLKIDKSFIGSMDKQTNTKIINMIIVLGRSLNLDIIAEGVETEQQMRYLSSKECQTFQGYYFSKPLPAHELNNILIKNSTLPL